MTSFGGAISIFHGEVLIKNLVPFYSGSRCATPLGGPSSLSNIRNAAWVAYIANVYRISSKNSAHQIFRHSLAKIESIVSNFGEWIPIYFYAQPLIKALSALRNKQMTINAATKSLS